MSEEDALKQIKKIAEDNNLSLDEVKSKLGQQPTVVEHSDSSWRAPEINLGSVATAGTAASTLSNSNAQGDAEDNKKSQMTLTAPKIMFIIGAILLYVGIMIALFQNFDESQAFGYGIATMLLAALSWGGSYYLRSATNENTTEDDIKIGLIDSSLLNGSLFLSTSNVMWVTAIDVQEGRGILLIVLVLLAVYTACHFLIYNIVKRLMPLAIAGLSIGSMYAVLSSLVFYGVSDPTVITFLSVILGFVFIAVGYLFHEKFEARELRAPFWSLGGLIIAGSLFALTLIETPLQILWTILYPGVIYLAYMMSIKLQIKTFLLTGSLFLVIYIMMIVFKYFSGGLGPAFAFIVAALAIIGSATLSLQLKKKYFEK